MITRMVLDYGQGRGAFVGSEYQRAEASSLIESTVRTWKIGPDAGDTNALIRQLQAALGIKAAFAH